MYLTPTENHWACDIEADNLLDKATTIWCATVLNIVTKEECQFVNAAEFTSWRIANPTVIFVGHNFLAYDAVMLNRFWGAKIPANKVVDTFVLSQLYNPTYPGGHSLAAWGFRLKYPKGEFNDFSAFSETMLKYCRRDTRLTGLLYRRLTDRMRAVGFSESGCELEHLAWNIIQNKQRKNGFPFDYRRAEELYIRLRGIEKELQDDIYKLFPPKLECVGEYKQSRLKDGRDNAQFVRHSGQYPRVERNADGSYRVYDYVSFNLGSPPQRIEKLLELGWKPVNFTKKTDKGGGGNPKIDEDELVAFAELSGNPEIALLAKWIVINSRANMLYNVKKNGEEGGWLTAYNKETGCLHGKLFIASTLRYKHSSPNSANIPAVRLKKDNDGNDQIQYGIDGGFSYESRDLYTSGGSDWSLVGIDGTGIQTRCLIHGLIKTVGPERVEPFKKIALEGDIHKRNIEVLGLAHKAAAKKFFYTLMMGGGGGRLAADQSQFGTKLTAKEGDALKTKMIGSMPGFGELIEALEKELSDTGRIKLCDDTPILVPSPHMVIPYLLQGDESRLMKKAKIFVDDIIRRNGWVKDVLWVADIHDEWQIRVRKGLEDEFIKQALPCFNKAGEFFNYLIQIDGDAKAGHTWAETH